MSEEATTVDRARQRSPADRAAYTIEHDVERPARAIHPAVQPIVHRAVHAEFKHDAQLGLPTGGASRV